MARGFMALRPVRRPRGRHQTFVAPKLAINASGRMVDPEAQRIYLEDLLQTCLSLGPVVSIGRPQDATPPLGVPRAHVGAHWQTAVIALMDISSLIVMAISDSEGVTWEVASPSLVRGIGTP